MINPYPYPFTITVQRGNETSRFEFVRNNDAVSWDAVMDTMLSAVMSLPGINERPDFGAREREMTQRIMLRYSARDGLRAIGTLKNDWWIAAREEGEWSHAWSLREWIKHVHHSRHVSPYDSDVVY